MRVFMLVMLLCCQLVLVAQIQKPIPYKGYARDEQGNYLVNKEVSVRFTILSIYHNSTIYQEVHKPTTNQAGAFFVEIGNGQPVIGKFNTMRWDTCSFDLLVETAVDRNGEFVKTLLLEFPHPPSDMNYFPFWDSIHQLQYPVTLKLPFGSNILYKHQLEPVNAKSHLSDSLTAKELYSLWSYYLKLVKDPILVKIDEQYLPKIMTREFIGFGKYFDPKRAAIPKVIKLTDSLALNKFSYRLPNMGIYEAYYLTEMPYDYSLKCRQTLRENNEKGCCLTENLNCQSYGLLILYNRTKQVAKIIMLYNLKSPYLSDDGGNSWRYGYILNDKQIVLYDGTFDGKEPMLKEIHRISISGDGNITDQIIK